MQTFSLSSPLKSIHNTLPNCEYMPTLIHNVAFTTTAPKKITETNSLLKSREKALELMQ